MNQRLAGQSFPNGILIRSEKTWALATDDGNLRFGSLVSWLDHHPIFKIVFIRSIVGLIESIAFSVRIQRESGRDTSREFVRPLVYYLAVMAPIGLLIDRPGADPSWPLHVGMQMLSLFIAFTFFTRALPGAIWSYHGAEHKAVHAHEQSVDLNDLDAVAACSRVHNRCGTNLVTFLATASMLRIPSGPPLVAMAGTIVYTLFSIGIAIEIFRLVTRTTHLSLSRLLLAPGRAMQRYVTTREPDSAQLAVAVRAVQTVLAADGMKSAQKKQPGN